MQSGAREYSGRDGGRQSRDGWLPVRHGNATIRGPQPMSNRTWSFSFGLAITALVLACHAHGVFDALENRSVDWRFARRVVRAEELKPADPNVVIVEITSECLERQGRWPWGRDTLASLVNIIQSGGPRVL